MDLNKKTVNTGELTCPLPKKCNTNISILFIVFEKLQQSVLVAFLFNTVSWRQRFAGVAQNQVDTWFQCLMERTM